MKLNQNYVVKVLAGEPILVHQDEHNVDFSKVITLNELALLIIEKIKEGSSLEEIVAAILAEYEVDEATARTDAIEFIEKLKELGIVND